MIEQTDNKLSKTREDLVNTKEDLNKAMLSKEVLGQEQAELCKYTYLVWDTSAGRTL